MFLTLLQSEQPKLHKSFDRSECNKVKHMVDSLDSINLKAPSQNYSRRHFNFFFYLSKKIMLDFSCESSA